MAAAVAPTQNAQWKRGCSRQKNFYIDNYFFATATTTPVTTKLYCTASTIGDGEISVAFTSYRLCFILIWYVFCHVACFFPLFHGGALPVISHSSY